MGMRVGFEEILDLEYFWDRLGEGLREKFRDEIVGFFEENKLFRALKDKGIRILEKGIRIAYWKFWNFLDFLQRDSNPRRRDSNRLKAIELLENGFESLK